jgi:hypothetical protein
MTIVVVVAVVVAEVWTIDLSIIAVAVEAVVVYLNKY